jgi:acetoin utilization deacetylase AcuC-like enzyme
MGKKAGKSRIPHNLRVTKPPIHKKALKANKTTLKAHWDDVQKDFAASEKSTLNNLYNLAHSLFGLLKHAVENAVIIAESLRKQLLIYLSQLIGSMATLYGKSNNPNAAQDKEVTLAFEKEVQEEVGETQLYYYSPKSCLTGHAIHTDKTKKEIGERIKVINDVLSVMPKNLIQKLESKDMADISCLKEIHSDQYMSALNNTSTKSDAFQVFGDKKKYPNVFLTDVPYEPNTLAAIQAGLGAATAAANITKKNLKDMKAEKLFCVIRPPSHHAHHEHPEGFCYASTVIYAAKLFMDEGMRVMVVDIDAHHGNGNVDQLKKLSQNEWYSDKYHLVDVYAEESYIEGVPRHEDSNANMSFYPLQNNDYTGANVLANLNKGIERARDHRFTPDVILVSAGFDAVLEDNYGGRLKPEDYSPIGAALAQACPHMISFLEGGYNLTVLPQSVKHYMLGTAGLANQPAPHHVKEGLTFVYNTLKNKIAPGHQTAASMQNNVKI